MRGRITASQGKAIANRAADLVRGSLLSDDSIDISLDYRVQIRNETDGPLSRFYVVGIGLPLVTPFQDLDAFLEQFSYSSATPFNGNRFAILQDGLSVDEIGPAKMNGVSAVRIKITDASDGYAAPVGTYTYLLSQTQPGPASIISSAVHEIPATTLDGGISDSATTLAVSFDSTDGKFGWPDPANTLGSFTVQIDDEDIEVTAVDGLEWTIERGANSTTAASHSDGASITFVSGLVWARVAFDGSRLLRSFCVPTCDGDQLCVIGDYVVGPCDEPQGSGSGSGGCPDAMCVDFSGFTDSGVSPFSSPTTLEETTTPCQYAWDGGIKSISLDADEVGNAVRLVFTRLGSFAQYTASGTIDGVLTWELSFNSITGLTLPSTITTTPGACADTPVVYFADDDICEDTTSVTIHGSGFLPTGNSVTFAPSGTAGTITYISAHELSVAITGQTAGDLDATVTNSNGTSNTEQVATVHAAPTITPDTSDVNQSTGNFTLAGTGFVPGSTSVSFDSGTWDPVSMTTTSITVDFTVAPSLGALNATVTTACGSDTQEVANIVSGGGGGSAPSALGGSSTTAAWPTPLSYSVTLPSGSGLLVVNIYYPTSPGSNTVTANGSAMTVGKVESTGAVSTGLLQQYYLPMTGPGSVTVAVSATVGTGAGILSNAYFVPSTTTLDAFARAQGTGGTADTGTSTSTTGAGGVVALFGFTSASIGSLTWNSPFTGDSSNNQHITIGGTDYWLVSGNTTIGSGVTFDAGLSGVTLGDWGGVAVSYK